jgi:hypothetical protein
MCCINYRSVQLFFGSNMSAPSSSCVQATLYHCCVMAVVARRQTTCCAGSSHCRSHFAAFLSKHDTFVLGCRFSQPWGLTSRALRQVYRSFKATYCFQIVGKFLPDYTMSPHIHRGLSLFLRTVLSTLQRCSHLGTVDSALS